MTDYDKIDIPAEELATNNQHMNIESLIQSSCLSDSQRANILESTAGISFTKANEIISFLINNQLDKIESGMNYNQTDINRKIREKMQNPKA